MNESKTPRCWWWAAAWADWASRRHSASRAAACTSSSRRRRSRRSATASRWAPTCFGCSTSSGVTDAVMRGADFPRRDGHEGRRRRARAAANRAQQRGASGPLRAPHMVIHRTDIHEILLDACRAIPGIEMTVGAGAVDYRQDATGAQVVCADGRVFSGAAVIGADGIRSRMRMHVVGEERPQPIGYVAHRSLLPMSEVPEIPNRFDGGVLGRPDLPCGALPAAPRHPVQRGVRVQDRLARRHARQPGLSRRARRGLCRHRPAPARHRGDA